jgi:hypothetical protein
MITKSRNNSIGIAKGYGTGNRGIGVRFPSLVTTFLHGAQSGSGVLAVTYTTDTAGCLPVGKTVGV